MPNKYASHARSSVISANKISSQSQTRHKLPNISLSKLLNARKDTANIEDEDLDDDDEDGDETYRR